MQAVFLGLSRLENSNSFGSGSLGMGFYVSVAAYAVSLAASTAVLIRMLTLINRASHSLAAAAAGTEIAMESFRHFQTWGAFKHGDVGCLTHIAARKGMTHVLQYLARNGANPSAMDSTGKTPLDIARGADMDSARDFLETLVAGENVLMPCSSPTGGGGDGKDERSRSPSQSLQSSLFRYRGSGSREGSEGGTADGEEVVRRWHHARTFVETVVRWVVSGERTSGKGLGKVAAEPLGAAARPPSTDEPQRSTSSPQPDLPQSSFSGGSPNEGTISPRISMSRAMISPRDLEDPDTGDVAMVNDPSQTRATSKRGDSGSCGENIDAEAAVPASDRKASATGTRGGNKLTGDDEERDAEAGAGSADSFGASSGDTTLAVQEALENTFALKETTRDASLSTVRSHQLLPDPGGAAVIETRPPTVASAVIPGPATVPAIKPTSTETDNSAVSSPGTVKTVAPTNQLVRRMSINLLRRLNSTSSASSFSGQGRRGSCISSTAAIFSPTQSVLNITWGLRRLRSFGTPRALRAGFVALRKTSPFHIPDIYLLAFTDMVCLKEIPCRKGNRWVVVRW